MARLGLIVNPTSGKNTGAQVGTEALTLLRAAGVDIVDLSAADARSAGEQGHAAIAAGLTRRKARKSSATLSTRFAAANRLGLCSPTSRRPSGRFAIKSVRSESSAR